MNGIKHLQKKYKWLNEPSVIDNTYSRNGESMIGFLSRSTAVNAKKCREFLIYNIPFLLKHYQKEYCSRFEKKWDSCLFELIVYRMFQELGASLSIEEQLETGRKPDFNASFKDTIFLVEATAPYYNKIIDKTFSQNRPLLNIIEDNCPEGWSVLVSSLPEIGLSESRKEFKKTIIDEFQKLEITNSKQFSEINIKINIANGLIDITLFPYVDYAGSKLLNEPAISFFSDAVQGIERTLHNKRKQVRKAGIPAIVAINLNFRADLYDSDTAIFGRTATTLFSNGGSEESLEASGYFGRSANMDGQPTIAGVIVFPEIGFINTDKKPVLYWNPRYKGKIPDSLNKLTQKFLTDNKLIKIKKVDENILSRLYL